jgi:hypothetical protein
MIMSTKFGKINPVKSQDNPEPIQVTRYSGGDKNGVCVQISIGDKYCQLNSKKILKLVELLMIVCKNEVERLEDKIENKN